MSRRFLALLLPCFLTAGEPGPKVREVPIYQVGTTAASDFLASSDARHLAWKEDVDSRECVVLDGARSPLCRGVSTVLFSEDGEHLAGIVMSDWPAPTPPGPTVMLDNELKERYEGVSDLAIDRHGSQFGFIAQPQGEDLTVVINGSYRRPRDTVMGGSLVLSREGGRYAFVARNQGLYYVATEDGLNGPYTEIDSRSLRFRPDAKHLSCEATTGEQAFILDGKLVGHCDAVVGPAYDSVGRSLAYALLYHGLWSITVRRPYSTYDIYPTGEVTDLVWSPDGKHLAYTDAKPLGGTLLVLDSTQVAEYDSIACLTFAPDGKQVAYAAFGLGAWRVVVDKTFSPRLASVKDLVVSPEGKHWACWTKERDKWYAVVDGEKVGSYHDTLTRIVFDSEHELRFIARRWNTYYRVGLSLAP